MWFWLWSGLIVAWLVGVFFGLRWLWRRFRALTEAVSQAAGVASRAFAHGQVGFTAASVPPPGIFADSADLAERALARSDRIAARRRRRRERDQAAYGSWAVLAGWRTDPGQKVEGRSWGRKAPADGLSALAEGGFESSSGAPPGASTPCPDPPDTLAAGRGNV
ncbi:MAG: hypothetical protein LBU05_00070 [Bifidobacteriaceae bacterium]|nr:hypothetical protein [Bifidobacteriaceae bacterium]